MAKTMAVALISELFEELSLICSKFRKLGALKVLINTKENL